MKRILAVLLLIGAMATPTAVSAAGEQVGVYVAPKFVYGLTQMDGTKGHWSVVESGNTTSGSIRIGNETDDAFGGSLAIGYDFDKKFGLPVRAELEYAAFSETENEKTYTLIDPLGSGDAKLQLKQTFQVQTLFVNAYWDIATGTQFTPYVGAGLGMAFINTKGKANAFLIDSPADALGGSTGSKNVTNFAWNVGAGLGYDFTENWTMDIGYRFVGLGSVKTKSYHQGDAANNYSVHGKTDNLYQHQLAIGLRYTF